MRVYLDVPAPTQLYQILLSAPGAHEFLAKPSMNAFRVVGYGVRAVGLPEPLSVPALIVPPDEFVLYSRVIELPGVGLIESRWHPNHGLFPPERPQLLLTNPDATGSDVDRLWRDGKRFLYAFDRANSGRREGDGAQYRTAEEFHAKRNEVIAELRRTWRKPPRDRIADGMFLRKSRYHDLLKRWPAPEK